ncbi:hypothetical protein [Flavobacterium sp.]|uniref:hypothetical protein n=1 Tax=Flavobacterium sp. TaxID=239 RepID=UPI00286C967E|nr:hypothetical protein [Flavobacterium sp.]
MKTKLLFAVLLMNVFGFAQTTKLTDPNIVNEYEIKFEKNTTGDIDVYITDSKNSMVSQRFTEKDNIPVSLLNSKVIKKITESSSNFNYYIPNTDPKIPLKISVAQDKITLADVATAIQSMDEATFILFLKSRAYFNIPSNKTNYKKYVEAITTVGQTVEVFPGVNKYSIKCTATNKFELYKNAATLSEIKASSEDGFFKILYDDCKTDNATIQLLFTAENLNSIKAIDIASNDNVKKLEELFNKIQGKEKILSYSYLGYVGTNFDLVDGLKAKNLFFATNIMVTPKVDEWAGFYISLYGNRAITRTDSILDIVREKKVMDSTDGNRYRIQEKTDILRTVQSDNLGAYFSPLIRIPFLNLNKQVSATFIYYAPSLEFIWRRSTVNIRYVNPRELEPILVATRVPTSNSDLPYIQKYTYDIYDFNIGIIGFWLCHENDYISVRLNMNTGYATRYAPSYFSTSSSLATAESQYVNTEDFFYTGKLWITERTTGITLQGEINNNLKHPTPFYGVTLSKAFDFDKIGTFFKPISTRTTP